MSDVPPPDGQDSPSGPVSQPGPTVETIGARAFVPSPEPSRRGPAPVPTIDAESEIPRFDMRGYATVGEPVDDEQPTSLSISKTVRLGQAAETDTVPGSAGDDVSRFVDEPRERDIDEDGPQTVTGTAAVVGADDTAEAYGSVTFPGYRPQSPSTSPWSSLSSGGVRSSL